MTIEEFEKVPFRMALHLAMADEYVGTYVDESGRLGFVIRTERVNEFETGKVRKEYRIDSKWYKSKKKFIEALVNFSYGPELPKKLKHNDEKRRD